MLELHNFSGKVVITGTTGKEVVIHAVRRGKRELLDHVALSIRTLNDQPVAKPDFARRAHPQPRSWVHFPEL